MLYHHVINSRVKMNKHELEDLIKARFSSLTPKLRVAARYVLDSPNDVALLSMRTVASNANLQPASMLRFARELGFANYEMFKAVYTAWVSDQGRTLAKRAADLRSRSNSDDEMPFLAEMFHTEVRNLDQTLGKQNVEAFTLARQALATSRRIYILGLRSLFPAAFYLNYICGLFTGNTTLLSGIGGTYADELRNMNHDDVLVVFCTAPYVIGAVEACSFARDRGTTVIAITDSAVSPIAVGANVMLLAPNTSPSLLPSIVPALAVAQALASLMVMDGGDERLKEISNSDAQLRRFSVYVKD
jgi:DNA-binding MurR/RpiR family transcriptional regulator